MNRPLVTLLDPDPRHETHPNDYLLLISAEGGPFISSTWITPAMLGDGYSAFGVALQSR